MIENNSMCLNEFRKNLAALGNCSLRCSTTDRDVGARAMQRSDVSEQLAAFAIFPLIFVPFMQYTG